MRGCGIGQVPIKSEPLLDLTRLVRRVGRPMTGVDRVEAAYLAHFSQAGPVWGLVRTRYGYLLLDTAGCRAAQRCFATAQTRAQAERVLRKNAVGRCLPFGLQRMVQRRLPGAVVYLNVGHSNLTDRVIAAMRSLPKARMLVMVHDTIPLDYPDYQRKGSVDRFAAFLCRAATADVVLCNSEQTRRDVLRHAPNTPATHVALLGVDPPNVGSAPLGPWADQPYFVCIGTIEPRKNHALLLDIWEQDAPPAHLVICGQRGWENAAVFARLDRGIPNVHELNGLTDDAMFGLLNGARGLLFPSHAEGYGLPPVEAAALGVPLVLADLPIYQEVLGDIPVYCDASDRYLWAQTINRLTANEQKTQRFEPPGWAAHFKSVLTLF